MLWKAVKPNHPDPVTWGAYSQTSNMALVSVKGGPHSAGSLFKRLEFRGAKGAASKEGAKNATLPSGYSCFGPQRQGVKA